MTLRLGYACINIALQETGVRARMPKKNLCVNKSCIAKTFRDKGVDYAIELARSNLQAVLKVLQWNEEHGIRVYRLSSNMFPHLTNPEFIGPNESMAYSLDHFDDLFQQISEYAREHGHRLTFHPGQYNQIGAKNVKVLQKTVHDLSAHAEILDRLKCGPDSVMVVHGGGTYENKPETIKRWIKQFHELPQNVQGRIVIENCERQYNYLDMLEISQAIDRPVVFDTHHHSCYSQIVQELPHPATFIEEIIGTWTRHGLTPKVHISEQAPGKRLGAHSDYVEVIPDYLWDLVDAGQDLDVMVEAKCKEQAVLSLYSRYYSFDDRRACWVRS